MKRKPSLNGKPSPVLDQSELVSLRFTHECILAREKELDLLRMGQAHLLGNILEKYKMPKNSSVDLSTGQISRRS